MKKREKEKKLKQMKQLKPRHSDKFSEILVKDIESIDEEMDEEDAEYYSEIFIDELENGDTGSILEEAEEYQNHFESNKIELKPGIHGKLIFKRKLGLMSKTSLRYFLLLPSHGLLIKFRS